jgi:hypothetical protein
MVHRDAFLDEQNEGSYYNDYYNSAYDAAYRFLAEDDTKEKTAGFRMDYSVLSVAVMTLGLIMVVEVLRHRLDHAAMGRPYFSAVLENIYGECTYIIIYA